MTHFILMNQETSLENIYTKTINKYYTQWRKWKDFSLGIGKDKDVCYQHLY